MIALGSMSIVAVGVNYTSASLPVREALSVSGLDVGEALAVLRTSAREAFVLSTCNRTEVYGVVERSADAEILLGFLANRSGLDADEIRSACYVHVGETAVRHALRVASGLDSMVLGEDQIQAQVKRSLAEARSAGALGATLERLGAAALACGKRVRTLTGVGRHSVSLESLAIRAAMDRVGSLQRRSVLVVGTGESASLILRQLRSAGAGRVTVVGRSPARASAVALMMDAVPRTVADLPHALSEADVVFCCTAAPHPVVTPEILERRIESRANDALLCVDLGTPRDVHPSVRSLPRVTVIALGELASMADAHREARRAHIPAAEAIVETEVARFLRWLSVRGAAAAIAAVDAHATAVAESELALAMARLPALSPRERDVIAEMVHRIVRKLAHQPIHALKQEQARSAEEIVS
jgi:glutamyl-tRNA reductase